MHPLTLDSQMLNDLYGGSQDDTSFILHDYLDKHAEIITSLTQAFQSGTESLSRCIHLHSATFSYIGIPQLTTICKNFEQECKKAADTVNIKTGFDEIVRMVEQSAILVKKELARISKES